jgi:bacteriorhodopsin
MGPNRTSFSDQFGEGLGALVVTAALLGITALMLHAMEHPAPFWAYYLIGLVVYVQVNTELMTDRKAEQRLEEIKRLLDGLEPPDGTQ